MINHSLTLPRLDSWYAQRVRRNYTRELGIRTADAIDRTVGVTIPELEEREAFRRISDEYRRPEKVIGGAQRVFTRCIPVYSVMISNPLAMKEGANISNGVFQEYLLPALESARPMLNFVKGVDSRMNRTGIDESTIDEVLLQEIGGRTKTAQFIAGLFNAIPLAAYAFRANNPDIDAGFTRIRDMCAAMEKPIERFYHEIFRDLPEQ